MTLIFSIKKGVVTKIINAMSRAYERAGLKEKLSKREIMDEQACDDDTLRIIGIDVYHRGVLLPASEKLRDVVARTHHILTRGYANPAELESLVGSWIWMGLLRRPVYSILSASYRIIRNRKQIVFLPVSVRWELLALISVSPLICVDLYQPTLKKITAMDASNRGGGVCYVKKVTDCDWPALTKWHIDGCRSPPPVLEALIRDNKWKTSISTRWKRSAHINELEMEAHNLALLSLCRTSSVFHHRPPMLLDSLVCFGALSRGRSRRLNYHCRRAAAILLSADLRPYWVWVPTHLNPADGPSRA
eukprot:Lithocolla_globosa_v1_NODE_140_length_5790_cov_49.678989.p2 type:complete len:304 gc:universal NODE_140_length_5790_cov_49.678989:1509-2420(+)